MTDLALKPNLHLVSGHLLARNVIWNLLGTAAPLAVAIPAVPILIHTMGADRFGVLTLCWVLIGYFSLFDLGLGRALTRLLAEKLGTGEHRDIPSLIWTALLAMSILGCVGAAVFAGCASWMVRGLLRVPAQIQSETLHAFFVLSAALPIVITSTALRGSLEAYQRFREVSGLRALLGISTFASPLLVMPFSHSLLSAAAALATGRVLVWIVNLVLCLIYIPGLNRQCRVRFDVLVALARYGSWMTISNIVSPMLTYLDRFAIGAMMSVAAVAYYATPFEFVTKVVVIPGAMIAVLFPAFSTSFVQDRNSTTRLFESGTKFVFLALFPCVLVIVALAHQGLNIWLGAEFAKTSTVVVQWLAAGVFMNGLAQVPFAQVQAVGRPDLAAKLNLAEMPLYGVLLWFLLGHFGIAGAAIAWTIRVSIDCILLFLIAGKLLPHSAPGIRRLLLSCTAAMFTLLLSALLGPLSVKLIFVLIVGGAFLLATWRVVLTPQEKSLVWGRGRSSLAAS
ncbi:MAG: flippase [Acidobacteriia bacterium]|nr:flippase [Terriglobia bacterium]